MRFSNRRNIGVSSSNRINIGVRSSNRINIGMRSSNRINTPLKNKINRCGNARCTKYDRETKKRSCKKYEESRRIAGVEKVQDIIERSRLQWYGHMRRLDENRIPLRMFNLETEGRRRRGRPRLRWVDMIHKDIQKRGLDPTIVINEEV
uniref:Endonuclease-reverse transcriptase n=1 Tax=Cacopsylla melanoneura TaxID=428564 RepID=A0A8D8TBG6_9HEMI